MIAIRASTAAVLLNVIALVGCAASSPPTPPTDGIDPGRPAEASRRVRAIEGRHRGIAPRPIRARDPKRDPIGCGAPRNRVEGTILAVDDEVGIFLISPGEKHGVRAGDEFTVSRGDSFVAMVIADLAFPEKSSARVKWSDGVLHQLRDIRVGDRIASVR